MKLTKAQEELLHKIIAETSVVGAKVLVRQEFTTSVNKTKKVAGARLQTIKALEKAGFIVLDYLQEGENIEDGHINQYFSIYASLTYEHQAP